MRKIVRTFLFVALLSLSFTIGVAAVDICINGYPIQFNSHTGTPFIDANNRTQVPLRQTMEAFRANVSWDAGLRQAIVTKYGITVTVPIDHFHILVNNVQVDTDTAAMIVDNRTYLPIRAVVEAFGAQVSWDGHTVNISTYEGMYAYTLAQAQSIALLHAEHNHAEVVFLKSELVYQSSWVYLFTFCSPYNTYDYIVDANTGQILSYVESDIVPDDLSAFGEQKEVTPEIILALAISYAGLEYASDVQMTQMTETTNGITSLYIVTLVTDGYTYILEVNPDTGEVRQLELSYTATTDATDENIEDSYNYDDNSTYENVSYGDNFSNDNSYTYNDDDSYEDSYGNNDNIFYGDNFSDDNSYTYDDDDSYEDSYGDNDNISYGDNFSNDNSYSDGNSYAENYGFSEDYDGSVQDSTYEDDSSDSDYGYVYGDAGEFDDYDFNYGNDW